MRINPGFHLILGKEQLLDPRVKEWFPEIKALPLAALQLRIKTNSIPRLSKRIDSFLSNFEGSKFPLILNDYPFFADSRSFQGVHCGQDDWPLEKIKGASRLIKGLSTHNSEQLSLALRNSHLDYVGFGPWFPSETKETQLFFSKP